MENTIQTHPQTHPQTHTQANIQAETMTETQPKAQTTKCLNCDTVFEGNFCPECGQSAETGRFTMRFILENLLAAFTSRDGGLWFTLKNLFSRPSAMIVEILNGKRRRYFSPFPLLFFTLTVYVLLFTATGSRSEYREAETRNLDTPKTELEKTTDEEVSKGTMAGETMRRFFDKGVQFYNNHYTAVQMLTLPLFLFATRLCYGKSNRKRYFRAEYAVAIVYAMVMVVLYRCIVSLVYLASPHISDTMGKYHPVVLILAFTACFHKMMGFRFVKTTWRSVLTIAVYGLELLVITVITLLVFGIIVFNKYYK